MKYYIYSYKLDYFRAMCSEVIDNNNVRYISDPIFDFNKNLFVRVLYRLHHWWVLNYLFKLPFKRFWNKYMFKGEITEPTCFIFFMNYVNISNDYTTLFSNLKKNPNVKFVMYFEDLVSSRKGIRFDLLNKYFDLVLTFDKGDAEKYGFTYYPSFLSKLEKIPDNNLHTSQACFYGAAKKRYDSIINIYSYLSLKGISCDFGVSRLRKENKKIQGISYIDYIIPYSDYIQHVYNTGCIVEIIQDNSVGYTLRTWEALIYRKKLLTNNKSILDAPFYNPSQFCYFESIDDIDIEFFTRSFIPNTDYLEQISPRSLLKFIENRL